MSVTGRPELHTPSSPCAMVPSVQSFSFWFSSVIFYFWLNYLIKYFHSQKNECCCRLLTSLVSDSVQPYGLQPARMLQARVLEWVAVTSSRGSSQPRDRTRVSSIAGRFFTTEPPGKPLAGMGEAQIHERKKNNVSRHYIEYNPIFF